MYLVGVGLPKTQSENQLHILCLTERLPWTVHQNMDALERLTFDMLIDFVPRFLRSVYVDGIAYGNLSRARAFKLADIVESKIPKDAVPLLAQELLDMDRAVEIEKGSYYLRETESEVHGSNCVTVYLQGGECDTRSEKVLSLLYRLLKDRCFHELRTKEQLGYVVSTDLRRDCGVNGFTVTVQGDRDPAYIEERIDAFLRGAEEYLEDLSEEEFQRHRVALASLRAQRPTDLYTMKVVMWAEISLQTYNFDRARVDVEILNSITKEEVIQFYKDHIGESPNRRKLVVHVVSTAEGRAGDMPDNTDISNNKHNGDTLDNHGNTSKQPTKITDLIEFKSRRRLYPRPVASTAVPRRGA